jgi:hypothetical protein
MTLRLFIPTYFDWCILDKKTRIKEVDCFWKSKEQAQVYFDKKKLDNKRYVIVGT